MLRNLNPSDISHLKSELEEIEVAPQGIDIMLPKSDFYVFKTDMLNSHAAILLKEKMLDINGECAIADEAVTNSDKEYATVLMGTRAQFDKLVKELNTENFPKLDFLIEELKNFFASQNGHCLKIRDQILQLDKQTLVMGILNITPDSFSDGGQFDSTQQAISKALEMEKQGADIIDVGGESTRPGAEPVSLDEELKRVIPVIEGIRQKSDVFISIDTYKSEVAEAALKAGADIVNDISGLNFDSDMADVVASYGATLVVMHIKGTPLNMQDDPQYKNIFDEILEYLDDSVQKARKASIDKNKIIVDPGIGFGKEWEDNYLILRHLNEFKSLGQPLLIGPSKKSFLGKLLDLPVDQRLEGTLAAVTAGIMNGADIVRVHDLSQAVEAVQVADKIYGKE
ncbi:MAG TPA: dihydropteroate synthase [bacterium]|nr:dihydropteroate synthase [bacterium]